MLMLYEAYKDLYSSEIERRDELNKAIDRPIGLIGAFSGLIYLALNRLSTPVSTTSIVVGVLILISGICLVRASWFAIRSYIGRTYFYVATPGALESYRLQLVEYHREYPDVELRDPEAEVLNHYRQQLVEAADRNAEINTQRSSQLHQSKISLVIALPFVVSAVVLSIGAPSTFSDWWKGSTSIISQRFHHGQTTEATTTAADSPTTPSN